MRIGYPCINRSIGCTANSTFRLVNYSGKNLFEKILNNLSCLKKILEFNAANKILFFRISSDLVPFASHPVCKIKWEKHFSKFFREVGSFIREKGIRISMHPGPFVVINSKDAKTVRRSFRELEYHSKVLETMNLDSTAKIQIHLGGVYGSREKAIKRFFNNFRKLSYSIRKRIVIENDLKYNLHDCLQINHVLKIPVVFDLLHHEYHHKEEPEGKLRKALRHSFKTWERRDGDPMVDYSTQKKGAKKGAHAESINLNHFRDFIRKTKGFDFDIMLEINDKEKSALKAVKFLKVTE